MPAPVPESQSPPSMPVTQCTPEEARQTLSCHERPVSCHAIVYSDVEENFVSSPNCLESQRCLFMNDEEVVAVQIAAVGDAFAIPTTSRVDRVTYYGELTYSENAVLIAPGLFDS